MCHSVKFQADGNATFIFSTLSHIIMMTMISLLREGSCQFFVKWPPQVPVTIFKNI